MKAKELIQKLEQLDENKEVYKTSYDYEEVSKVELREVCTGWDRENQEKIYEEVPVLI